ncbi:MAG TPA: AIM24 family protein [Steroidobacteraceae bacterium]|nr:AIM24 family protein [Steroidobacteraceae bacterium]
MRSQIKGTTMPVLEIGLEPNDRIVAEPGEFSWMTQGVQMRTTAYSAGARGLWSAIGRAFSGGGLFMTEYSAPAGHGVIAFAARVPRAASPAESAGPCCATCSAATADRQSSLERGRWPAGRRDFVPGRPSGRDHTNYAGQSPTEGGSAESGLTTPKQAGV